MLQYRIKCTSQVLLLQEWHSQLQQIRLAIEVSRWGVGEPIDYSDRLTRHAVRLTTLYDSLRSLRQHMWLTLPALPASIPTSFQEDYKVIFYHFGERILQWEQLFLVILSRIEKVQSRHARDQQRHEQRLAGGARFGFPTAGGVVYHPKLYSHINRDLLHLAGLIAGEVIPRLKHIIDPSLRESATSPFMLDEAYRLNAFTPIPE